MEDTPKPLIVSCNGHQPRIDSTSWLAPNCTIVGEVEIGAHASCWFQSVIRGDVAPIVIGERVNIQDGAIIHGTFEKSQTLIEARASIGHRAIVHGAHIGEGALIGMGAIVMDHAVVGAHAVIAAGAVLLEGTVVPAGTLWAGIPARNKGPVSDALLKQLSATSDRYIEYAGWFSR